MIFTNDKAHGGMLKSEFTSKLKAATQLTIATGYFGASLINELKPALLHIPNCKILIGMVFHSGVTQKQKLALSDLDSALRQANPENGIFIFRKEYHGKIYQIDHDIYMGSSNLSELGFNSRLECTTKIADAATQTKVLNYLDFLFSNDKTAKLNDVTLKVKSRHTLQPKRMPRNFKVPNAPTGTIVGEMNIELRVDKQPASSLNLYFDRGRKNAQKVYAPRPWYEIEITATAEETRNHLYPPSTLKPGSIKSRQGSFNAYINEGNNWFKLNMAISSDDGKAIFSNKLSGGRETLGRFIKGKFESLGLLRKGERITSETLEEYGRNFITLKKIDDNNYILEF